MKVLDMHCDTIGELYGQEKAGVSQGIVRNSLMVDLEKMERGDYGLQVFALFVNLQSAGDDPFARCMEMADTFYRELSAYPDRIGIVRTYEDIEKNWKRGRMSALLSIEEGGTCRGNLAFLRDFYRLGVRMMTLTWNYPNELAYPNRFSRLPDGRGCFEAETERGLTETGIAFVEEMDRLGMIIDVSHLGDKGIWDVLERAKGPVVASHSNARALASHPRNLTDDMIRRLSEKGGVMGINYCAAFLEDFGPEEKEISRISRMVEHMKHIRNVGGIGCIGLGSDFDGISCPLEMENAAALPRLAQEMERAGFSVGEIEAVFYGNALRVFREVLA